MSDACSSWCSRHPAGAITGRGGAAAAARAQPRGVDAHRCRPCLRGVRAAPAGDRGARVRLVHHGRRDRAVRLSHARGHPARRARHVRHRRSQLQPVWARAGSRSRATTTAAILLLVNGHRVNDNVFGQAEIGAEFGIDPAMFERVEIIRGPASSLYGDSAFFAVVNVITRSGASLDGVSLALEGGTLGTLLTRVSAGHRLANGVDVAVSGTLRAERRRESALFSRVRHAGHEQRHRRGARRRAAGRSSTDNCATRTSPSQAAYGRRRRDVPTASFGTLFNEQEVAGADDRSPHAGRCRVLTGDRPQPPDGARLVRSSSPTTACIRSRGEAAGIGPGRAQQRAGHQVERRGQTHARAARPTGADARRRVHRQRPSGPAVSLRAILPYRCSRPTIRLFSTRSTSRTRSS